MEQNTFGGGGVRGGGKGPPAGGGLGGPPLPRARILILHVNHFVEAPFMISGSSKENPHLKPAKLRSCIESATGTFEHVAVLMCAHPSVHAAVPAPHWRLLSWLCIDLCSSA